MLDGDLSSEERRSVEAHLRTCEPCSSYYNDMAAMLDAMWLPDSQPPESFRSRWKHRIATASQPKKKVRPAVLIPAFACGVAGIFLATTAIVNPQSFGLGGENLRAKASVAAVPPAQTQDVQIEDQIVTPFEFGPVRTAAPTKTPAMVAPEYSEQTTKSDEAGITAEGALQAAEDVQNGSGRDAVSETSGESEQAEPVSAELTVPDVGAAEEVRASAAEFSQLAITDAGNGELFIAGPFEYMELAFAKCGYTLPMGTEQVHVLLESITAD